MAYMHEIIALLEKCAPYLVELDNILHDEFSRDDNALGELIEEVEMRIKEHNALKIGHLART